MQTTLNCSPHIPTEYFVMNFIDFLHKIIKKQLILLREFYYT